MPDQIPDFLLNQNLYEGSTEFEKYTVVDSRYNNRPARILYTDNQMAAQSGLPFDDNPEMLFDYNQRFMEIVGQMKPKSCLVIGGGAFTLPMAISKLLPTTDIDVFELDGGLIPISEKYFGFRQTEKVRAYIGDGRQLLRRSTKTYDVILIDVFNSVDIPKDFNQPDLPAEIRERLHPNGVVAMNIIAAYHGLRAETLKNLEASFKNVFNEVNLFPAGSAISLWMSQNFILLAGEDITDAANALSYNPIT